MPRDAGSPLLSLGVVWTPPDWNKDKVESDCPHVVSGGLPSQATSMMLSKFRMLADLGARPRGSSLKYPASCIVSGEMPCSR